MQYYRVYRAPDGSDVSFCGDLARLDADLRSLIAAACARGARVAVQQSAAGEIHAVRVEGLPGIGDSAMPPVLASELLRSALETPPAGIRLQLAMRMAGVTPSEVLNVVPQAQKPAAAIALSTDTFSARHWPVLVELAQILGCDPLWLITGYPFNDARIAGLLVQMRWANLPLAVLYRVRNSLAMLPAPDLGPGRCRYCGRGPSLTRSLPDPWLDAAKTICRLCVERHASSDTSRKEEAQ